MQKAVFNPHAFEDRWRKSWQEQQLFLDEARRESSLAKIYLLFAFAYPSGSGLHVGHVESKTALDIVARFSRMNGRHVFFPVGWDAFGLPAENYAIKTGVHPTETTKKAINTFRRQIKRLGISYDWANELATSHPDYYRWTQWLFLQLYLNGLAYQAEGGVNWCPQDQTVLANEQVINGKCDRCGTEVIQKQLKQWYFKITDYKDELISGLDQVDWPEATKQQQLNWIGKSEGAEVKFQISNFKFQNNEFLECFTTRLDTICGVTFVVISPEKFEKLDLIQQVEESSRESVQNYIDKSKKKTEEERKIGEKDKTGVDTGIRLIHPLSDKEIPLWIADYVLAGYGTGVVMGVPAHDQRDMGFANKFDLEVIEVVKAEKTNSGKLSTDQKKVYSDFGFLINSGQYSGLQSEVAVEKMLTDHPKKFANKTTYKLRDWLISRQRYWGAPIPIVYDPDGKPHPVKEEHLPWLLPTDVDFNPHGLSPLATSKEFIQRTEQLYGKGWRPEFDTMDTFVDSSWYFLRYPSARWDGRQHQKNKVENIEYKEKHVDQDNLKLEIRNLRSDTKIDLEGSIGTPFDLELTESWLPVDFYMIGPEHIVLHLLYSRFFTKFMRDQGYIDFDEPFIKMRHQGMILGPDGRKMSKSKGNVINPDEVIEKYGADTLRMYEMFMGPIDADKPWSTNSVVGMYRFLARANTLVHAAKEGATSESWLRAFHKTLQKVTDDIPDLKFNTAIAAMMEFINFWEKAAVVDGFTVSLSDVQVFVQMLAPFAPFLAEELWQSVLGQKQSIHLSSWPKFDSRLVIDDRVKIVIQVNGKLRGELMVDSSDLSNKNGIIEQAKEQEKVKGWIAEKEIVKEIYVPGKLVNLVYPTQFSGY